ncbi:MAG: HU family DNA-binding protein [Firmicutes bacterium]|nr:HU family DNA-binding protein [Bacillota bacterium]
MNKKEFIEAIAKKSNLEKNKAGKFLKSFIDVVMEEVGKSNEIQLVGFGTFKMRERKERTGRNPKTGGKVKISKANVPVFKPGKTFKNKINLK